MIYPMFAFFTSKVAKGLTFMILFSVYHLSQRARRVSLVYSATYRNLAKFTKNPVLVRKGSGV